MKIFKSIKWRLQLWYGLILVAVLVGFGTTAYQLQRRELFGRIDNELHRRIGVLANALHRPHPPHQDLDQQPFDRPAPGQMAEDGPPPFQRNRPAPEFNLPAEDAHFFDADDPHDFYFKIIIATRDGEKEIAQSTNQPAKPEQIITDARRENQADIFSPTNLRPQTPARPVNFGNYREASEELPSGEHIRVGCSIAPELREIKMVALELFGFGAAILFLGLVGGWWFVGRSLKPISEISSTAIKISSGDLSQRINVAEAESELGQLAAVLNSTFARLETAFAQQKQFASDAAHELRTPVSVILTQTQTALNRERDAAGYKQTVEACQRAAQRMRKLIELLLELARFDAGQEILQRMQFDFAKTIFDSVELVQALADERGVKIISQISPLKISGDAERLAQVVTNLLTNAIQYNRNDGEVRIELFSENNLAVLKVIDTGQGIGQEDLPRVFERFYRADKSRTGAGNSGLGLSICQAIIAAHGGTIEIASEKNSGTTFIVRLPIA